MKEPKAYSIISRAETIADVLLKHLGEEGGCKHKIDAIVEEAFGPTLESKGQYHNCSVLSTKERVTT